MNDTAPPVATEPKPSPLPRLWPGVTMTLLFWVLYEGLRYFLPGSFVQVQVMFFGPMVLAALFLGWWLFFSRLAWRTKLVPLGVLLIAGTITALVAEPSMAIILPLVALPVALTGWALAMAVTRRSSPRVQQALIATAIVVTCVYYSLLRLDGINGSMYVTTSWRWQPTAEDQFLSARPSAPSTSKDDAPAQALELQPGDWPGFRGPERDSRVKGVTIATDWQAHPPQLVWKQRVGPGWGSFAVVSGRLFTQEQRGDQEAVVCYDADSGAELWTHFDTARFSEIVAGAGPRATPTFANGRIYAFGGNGNLNCLDAVTGQRVWSIDVKEDLGVKPPQWGFASSPLVTDEHVVVFTGGKDHSVAAYRATDGERAWTANAGELSYSSLQLARLGDETFFLMVTDQGLTALRPTNGEIAWQHAWEAKGVARVTQPQFISATELVYGCGESAGTARIKLQPSEQSWTATEAWTTTKFQPDFNDFVIHDGHLYGFDGNIFACIDLATGQRTWKKGRYGHGQVLLLADQPLLLVLSEKGEGVLLEPNPKQHVELARAPLVASKTWNHPVLVGSHLYVRNGEEMACYQLATSSAGAQN